MIIHRLQSIKHSFLIILSTIIDINTKIEREFGAYDGIADNYPKYVLSMDKFDMSRNGIIHQNIIDFLLEK